MLGACAPHVPGIADPARIEAHCSPREARITGIRSVLSSTSDAVAADRPALGAIRAAVQSGDGAIAYWNAQLLLKPEAAKQLGETDGYLRVNAIAIPPAPPAAASFPVYLNVRDHGTYRWIAMRAFDVQDICIEGHKQA